MSNSLQTLKPDEVAVNPVEIEVAVTEAASQQTSLMFPPVGKELRGIPVTGTSRAGPLAKIIEFESDMFRLEAERLLVHQERFAQSPTYWARVSGLFQANQDFSNALKFAKRAAEVDSSGVFQYRLGESLLSDGDKKDAEKLFSALADSGDMDALYRLAELAIRKNDLSGARAVLDTALDNDEADWRLHLIAGTIALAESQYQDAIRHYRVALEGKANSSALYCNIAIAHFYLGQVEKALIDSRKALAIDPWNKNALLFHSDVLKLKDKGLKEPYKRLIKFRDHLEKYLWLEPKDSAVANRLAELYFFDNDLSNGIKVLETIEGASKDPGILNNLGVLWNRRDKEKAIRYFDSAIKSVGGEKKAATSRPAGIALLNLAATYLELLHYEEAFALADQYMSSASNDHYLSDDILCKIPIVSVSALARLGRIKDSVELASSVLSKKELYSGGKLELATLLTMYFIEVVGDAEKTFEYANVAYQEFERHPDLGISQRNATYNNMAFAYIELGDFQKAHDLLQRIDHGAPNADYAYATEGLIALRSGKLEAGVALYEKTLSKLTDREKKVAVRQRLNLEMARCLIKLRELSRAERLLNKVMKTGTVTHLWPCEYMTREAKKLLNEIKAKRT